MNKTYFETMAQDQPTEDSSIRSPLPQYQAMHTPASSTACANASFCNASHCHIAQSCHHGQADGSTAQSNVVPVALLRRWPALIECPGCRAVLPTNTDHVVGKGSHWMAAMFFCTTVIGVFIPYAITSFKDIRHSCARCGRKVATQRFGSGTKAHLM
ncbi:Putative LITAF domain containing protein [Colletotrichum destructivum]|uniref:LITAF domain containing protein n=1 Tax=Colletotrichum destructivum TaxID=34406 RepID=A0AAX4IM86_9PEZI|nr:Putative LITAF domain containing protein [Colletotrichum destructivum]